MCLLLAACTTTAPAPTLPASQPQSLFVTFRAFTTDGQDATCYVTVSDYTDVEFITLANQPQQMFAMIDATGLPCGVVPLTDSGINLLQGWEVQVRNNGDTPKDVEGIIVPPGNTIEWSSK
jgi:hypothetical protein